MASCCLPQGIFAASCLCFTMKVHGRAGTSAFPAFSLSIGAHGRAERPVVVLMHVQSYTIQSAKYDFQNKSFGLFIL